LEIAFLGYFKGEFGIEILTSKGEEKIGGKPINILELLFPLNPGLDFLERRYASRAFNLAVDDEPGCSQEAVFGDLVDVFDLLNVGSYVHLRQGVQGTFFHLFTAGASGAQNPDFHYFPPEEVFIVIRSIIFME
jgi:hypothetical protein